LNYELVYTAEADDDLEFFNKEQRRQIIIQIEKAANNPLPQNEGGYGKPLGNKRNMNLTGLCKIKLKKLGVRVIYKLIRVDKIMKILVIAARSDDEVYKIAYHRTNQHKLKSPV